MFCSRCGTEVEQDKQFCPTCGLDLRATTPVQAIATGDVTELDIIREALREEYDLLEELGRGGMAIVYRARERYLEREVAVKILPFSLAFDAEFVERFQREARTAAGLEHPNIIPIYRVGKSGRVIYFVMKMLRGSSLSRILSERRKMPPAEIRKLLIDVGKALAYAHHRGIVHRDIKPDNIMFDEFGHCVVTDFGIAKAVSGSRLTGTGMSIGTPHYMSPEQARAQPLDGRSDLYALGVVAYQALVGEVPYDGEDSFSIGYKHIMEPVPVPLLDSPDERRLFDIVKKLMMKDPLDRYQLAEEMVRALEGELIAQVTPSRRQSTQQLAVSGELAQPVPSGDPVIPSPIPAAAGPPSPRPSPPPPAFRPSPPQPSEAVVVQHDTPRRPVMRRSTATQPTLDTSRSGAFGWIVLLLVLGAFGFGGYLLWSKGFLGGSPAPPAAQPSDSASRSDSGRSLTPHPVESVPAGVVSQPAETLTTGSAIAVPPPILPTPAAPVDSGVLRISGNLPPGTGVLIDSRPLQTRTPEIRLPAGQHEVAILVPRRAMFVDTVLIEPGSTLVLTPELASDANPTRPGIRRLRSVLSCDIPTRQNNFGAACYDQRPTPLKAQVPLTPEITGTPTQAVLLVRVSADGQALAVRVFRPSSDSAFTDLAVEFARTVKWNPAVKDGRLVEGWTQWGFGPELR